MGKADALSESYRIEHKEDEYGEYDVLVRIADGVVVHEDGGEPEDQLLRRDNRDLVDELNRVAAERNDLIAAVEVATAEKLDLAKRMGQGCYRLASQCETLTEERDQARAEVERLRGLLSMAEMTVAISADTLSRIARGIDVMSSVIDVSWSLQKTARDIEEALK